MQKSFKKDAEEKVYSQIASPQIYQLVALDVMLLKCRLVLAQVEQVKPESHLLVTPLFHWYAVQRFQQLFVVLVLYFRFSVPLNQIYFLF